MSTTQSLSHPSLLAAAAVCLFAPMSEGAETNGGEFAYSERGEGRAIFLVHAGVFSEWFRLVEESPALDSFRVIRVRRAGYGSSRPAGHVTLADHGRHVAALAAHLGIEQLHWVGHSSSCQIGLALARERTELVRALVLLEPAAGGGFEVPASAELGPAFFGPAIGAFQAGDLPAAFDHFMRGVCGPDYRAILEARLGRDGVEHAIRESEFFFRDEIRAVMESNFGPAEAAGVKQPVLCLEGGAQPSHLTLMSRQISERVVQLLPQARVVIVPGVSHALPLQDPDAVAQAIASFVRALD
jgi:pimeloyl-ACP methyl ester carboxylesterase